MRRLALLMRYIGVRVGCSMVTVIVLIDRLQMVIGCRDVPSRGQMMVFARRVILGVRHDAFLDVDGLTRPMVGHCASIACCRHLYDLVNNALQRRFPALVMGEWARDYGRSVRWRT